MSRKGLEKARKEEESRTLLMKNRLSYIRHEHEKKYKTIQQAKKKYEHLVELRNQSIR